MAEQERETDYKRVIANNITELRKAFPLTQAELAEKLNYSDKAISKWERGESIPDVITLKRIADMFGVGVDYLLASEHGERGAEISMPHLRRRNRIIVTGLACMLAVLVATVCFVVLSIFTDLPRLWLAFVYTVPVCAVICIVFNSLWGRGWFNFPLISVLMWSLLASVYLTVGDYSAWQIFLIGVPGQIIILLWSGIRSHRQVRAPAPEARETAE
ncbi:MAG: helix-turn-helix domain-containing protein [Clostridia bacterium]|nr:helix-turn-helix domain-containing protein [Clostridia bacterium]